MRSGWKDIKFGSLGRSVMKDWVTLDRKVYGLRLSIAKAWMEHEWRRFRGRTKVLPLFFCIAFFCPASRPLLAFISGDRSKSGASVVFNAVLFRPVVKKRIKNNWTASKVLTSIYINRWSEWRSQRPWRRMLCRGRSREGAIVNLLVGSILGFCAGLCVWKTSKICQNW